MHLKPSTCLVRCLSASILCAALISPLCAWADNRPVGFAKGVTGGGNATVVHPATPDELKTALCATYDRRGQCTDETPRVIALDRTFDFRGSVISNGSAQVTEAGCMANACPKGGGQWAIDGANHFCQSRPPATVTYDKAGLQRLKIGSNKTLIGLGNHAGIQGMGLFVGGGAHNVIVRNLTLSDINPRVVWGGDALTLDNADGVWIDHDTFVRIGRQMVVTGWGSATHVTLSNNEFDGRTPYSATCDGHHYWVWLFLGHHDTLTLVGNYVHDTSGRAPHSGGMGDADVRAQLVNNLFAHLSYQGAIMSRTATSHLLVEGNAFEDVSHPLFNDTRQPGTAFAPFAQAAGDACRGVIGRPCVANQQHLSGDDYRPQDVPALAAFSASREYLITPKPAEIALAQVPANAGAGHLNAGKN
ncbi:pectate lyase [Pseudomonas sp. MUP55]|uniref:pectate lyase family protein n=1 Tax=Pseudomonas sp. MUP55 TaxID=3087234 RepID=UPI002A5A5530|nr:MULTISPECIES: pectate lyase [unclassified Pseudomonas]WPN90393.1 pectate lyase [Pseudomonas sp. MUP56]WPN95918.1 pectate lyase [Pseudomonas sp. MUP55]